MMSAMPRFEKGATMPEMSVTNLDGVPARLHDFRRKKHVVLVNEADSPEKLRAAVAADSQRWTWLQAVFVRPAADGLVPGIYVISRWGKLLEHYAPGTSSFDKIEKDILYFEAQDCCEI
jgi:hypothetical protein